MKSPISPIIVTFILATFAISTATVQGEDYLYETNNGTITITKYTGSGGDVTIPNEIGGMAVTSIGRRWEGGLMPPAYFGAFSDCTSLTSITIPNSVTEIGGWAFYKCRSLTSITIPDSVTDMGVATFAHCTSLTNAIIGNGVTSIQTYWSDGVPGGPEGAFRGCTNLTSVIIGNSVTSIDLHAFLGCTSLTSVIIPNGVTTIESYTFGECTSLTSVIIGNNVTSIAPYAFWYCTSLSNITLPNSVTSIGDLAFSECASLTGVYFNGNAPSVDSDIFYESDRVTVYYLAGATGWGSTLGGRPTAPWVLPYPVILTTAPNFGIQNNAFGFRISWATNASVVVEASATLANPDWSAVSTNTLVDGWCYFSDAEWANYPVRFYRVRQW